MWALGIARSRISDNCIAETGWCKGIKDGHNAPNLWISKSGTIHLIYGSHGTPFKYARSISPESIGAWDLGARLTDFATYPYFSELPNGELLLFFRYSPTGGYKNPFLGLLRTEDEGQTWTGVEKLGLFKKACKINGRNAIYDSTTGRVYLNLSLSRPKRKFMTYTCQYDPENGRMFAWDGKTDLGPLPVDDKITTSCTVDGLTSHELFLHDGTLFMLLLRGDEYSFAVWDGETLGRYDIPDGTMDGYRGGPIWTADGRHIRMFGIRDIDPPTAFNGGDL